MNSSQFDHITDQQLLEHYNSDRNNQWLGILLQRYTLLLFGVCMKYLKNEEEAKDAVQQIFLKVIAELEKYKVDYFKSWLYMVAKNYCLMQLRDKPGKYKVEVTEKLQIEQEESSMLEHIEKDRLMLLMEESMHELNDQQKQCVSLFYLEKRSYAEIAGQTGYNMLQVKSFIQNGKRNLKILIEQKLKQQNKK